MQVSSHVELHCGNHTGDELQEYKQGKVRLNFLVVLPHRVWHAFEHIGVFARMHSGHRYVFEEGERLNGECFVEVLFLYVLFDELIVNWFAVDVCRTEKHSGGEVILVIDDVHCVEPDILFFEFFLFLSV